MEEVLFIKIITQIFNLLILIFNTFDAFDTI